MSCCGEYNNLLSICDNQFFVVLIEWLDEYFWEKAEFNLATSSYV